MIGMDIINLDELEREENLRRYSIMFTKTKSIFDQLAALTATMLNAPLAMINFIDRSSVWNSQTSVDSELSSSLCSVAVLKEQESNFKHATKEMLLISNPLIAGEYGLKFYATSPIKTSGGFHVGAICIVDHQPRNFGVQEQEKLDWAAAMVQSEMNKRLNLDYCA